MSNLKEALKESANLIRGPKGALTNASTLNANLDFFYGASREADGATLERLFSKALAEDRETALASLLCALDVRGGKGERRIFKTAFTWLCRNFPDDARLILRFIPALGRWDYMFCAEDTPVQDDAFAMVSDQLSKDLDSEHPSLLAKWMPSHRTHGKNSPLARKLAAYMGMDQKTYRKTLGRLREALRVTERGMSRGAWGELDYPGIPAKAMLRYRDAFRRHDGERFEEYLEDVRTGKAKISAKGLLCYEVVRTILRDPEFPGLYWPSSLYEDDPGKKVAEWVSKPSAAELMWESQTDFLEGDSSNILVVADTSGSMFTASLVPISASLGLAVYTAERNRGMFADHFITFSSEPVFQELKGEGIREKIAGIRTYVENTDIDKVFALILRLARENGIPEDEMPRKLLILSDMAFDQMVDSENGTNFESWKKAFREAGYPMPQIIFWNLAEQTCGAPATARDGDVIMVSGFSPAFLRDIIPMEEITPEGALERILEPYILMLRKEQEKDV